MSKLNVTEGEWVTYQDEMTNLYVINTPENEYGFSEVITEGVYSECDAILMSQSKNLYNQLKHINALIFICSSETELADAITSKAHDIAYLLAQCRGESITCKN